jgi:hypothetical protein
MMGDPLCSHCGRRESCHQAHCPDVLTSKDVRDPGEGQFYQIMAAPRGPDLCAPAFERIVLSAMPCFPVQSSPGAAPWSVTPSIAPPGSVSGALVAFATLLDEVVLTLFVAGPKRRTLVRRKFAGVRENIGGRSWRRRLSLLLERSCWGRACGDQAPPVLAATGPRMPQRSAARRVPNCPNAALSLLSAALADGGHDRDRTCDPYHVKVVLSR